MKTFLPIVWAVALPLGALACGGPFEEAPPALPYYLDRLPAKPAAVIFDEANGAPAAANAVDFKAALLKLAADCDAGQPAAALLATTDQLLAQARLDPRRAATLCNLLNDVRDLFSATPAVTGTTAGGYVRWRVEHAIWFRLDWDAKPRSPVYEYYEDEDALQARQQEARQTLEKLAADPAAGPLRVHWLYLLGAIAFPAGGQAEFQKVVDEYRDHPRAEAALFMYARCRLAASRNHHDAYGAVTPADVDAAAQDRNEAEALFEQYLKAYPHGRFAADVPGWQGALAFADWDFERALDFYLQQADAAGHPEVLKSAAFMCERCLTRLALSGDHASLRKVAAHPRLAMSLIYLLANAPTDYTGRDDETPESVNRWRRALLPRLAAAVAVQKEAYASADWQPRYLALLAQAASGDGDQDQALALCDLGKDQLAKSDDLAFARLVALARARKLPEAIAAGREFAQNFPKSPLAPGAALRVALALVDNHQAGAALGEIAALETQWTAKNEAFDKAGEDGLDASMYPSADGNISAERSALHSDVTGAELDRLKQINDALLNFAPLPELAAVATTAENADAANLRAVLVERWLAEEENFEEAKKYATPAQWSVAAEGLEKLADEAKGAASAYERFADGWAAARGKLLFAPLETDETRHLYGDDFGASAGLRRRENGLALGFSAEVINHALSSRDEWSHAFAWHLKAADAAPAHSADEAQALWAALRMMPGIALVSPFTFQYAGETDASGLSRQLYTRLRQDCPDSREARELAVYYDLAPQPHDPRAQPDYSPAEGHEYVDFQEPEYRYTSLSQHFFDSSGIEISKAVAEDALALRAPDLARDPQRMEREVADMRSRLNTDSKDRQDYFLTNFLDDMADFLQEPASALTAPAVARYVQLRTECMSVEHWGWDGIRLPAVPDARSGTSLNDAVRAHIAAARADLEMASFYDYLDFLAMAVVANENIDIPVPGETEEDKDGPEGARVPATHPARDYPKLAKMAEDFLAAYPHSRKREAALLLRARALYCAQRPQLRVKEAAWPETGHFASGRIYVEDRQEPFNPGEIAAALDASDREFPKGRYASEIRNLRGLLAWRMHDWPRALDLTFESLADPSDPVLQREAALRLTDMFVDGLSDDGERARCLAAIKARPDAAQNLRKFLPDSPYPVRAMQTWLLAQL
jgi:hypothetical protein